MNIPGVFITGTGTDIGKTVVTAGLARFFKRSGINVLPVKPVQSGGIRVADGKLDSPDGDVYKSAGAAWDIDVQCPYIFEPACSPHLAAELAGAELEVSSIGNKVRGLEGRGTLLVEGAGGILVPLSRQNTMLDLMKDLAYPVVLVAGNKLGTINETLLSLMALKHAGLKACGVIMTSCFGPAPSEFGMDEDNIRSIEQFSGVKVLSSIPYIPDWNPHDIRNWETVDRAFLTIDIRAFVSTACLPSENE